MHRKTMKRSLRVEGLEERRVLAASVGWDGPGQGSAQLSYYIGQAPSGISQSTFQSAIQSALKAWSDVANISFIQTRQSGLNNSLDFTFESIDGKGGTLAQAYFPSDVNRGRIAGDVQFDSSERWEIGNAAGSTAFDLVLVAAHEIGHALGLDHSSKDSAILYPSVSPSDSFTRLDAADVSAIRSLYAAAASSTNSNSNSTNTNSTNTNSTNTNSTNTNSTNTGTTSGKPKSPTLTFGTNRTPMFTVRSWFAHWYSRFGRLSSGVEQMDAGVPTHQNLFNPLDVNRDNSVSPVDALLVINLLSVKGQLAIQTAFTADTSGDGQVTPLDALLVINGIGDKQSTTWLTIESSGKGPTGNNQSPTIGGCDVDDSDDVVPDHQEPDDSSLDDSSLKGSSKDTDENNHRHRSKFGTVAFGLLSPDRVDRLFGRFDDNADDLLAVTIFGNENESFDRLAHFPSRFVARCGG